MNKTQKKKMRRFHRYLETGQIHDEEEIKESKTLVNDKLTSGSGQKILEDKPTSKPKTNKKKAPQQSYDGSSDPNFYKHYIDQLYDYGDRHRQYVPEPKHKYTIHLHRAVFTEELYALYKRYEKHVHKWDATRRKLKWFLCNSPLFDPVHESKKATTPMVYSSASVDKYFHEWKDEGHCPKTMGTYHMYHRIDGQLVAVGVIDITSTYLNSAYCMYDPDFMFLNLGVVTCVREIEFCHKLRAAHFPKLKYYHMGEMVP